MKLSFALLVVCLAGCGGKKEAPAGPRKLAKLEVRVGVDNKGRIRPAFQLFDSKLKPVAVTGTYSVVVGRPDGTELCKLDGTFAPADFDSDVYRAEYRDASCPTDPATDNLKIVIKVVTPEKTIDRTLELPARNVWESLPAKAPTGGGSGSGSGSGSAGSGSAGSGSAMAEAPAGSGSAGSGSAGSGSAGSGSAGSK